MDERRINIDEFFRREMDNRADAPPPAVWEALEQRLDQPLPGRKKPFPVWWFLTIAGLILLSAGIIAGYMNGREPETTVAEQVVTLPAAPAQTPTDTDEPVSIVPEQIAQTGETQQNTTINPIEEHNNQQIDKPQQNTTNNPIKEYNNQQIDKPQQNTTNNIAVTTPSRNTATEQVTSAEEIATKEVVQKKRNIAATPQPIAVSQPAPIINRLPSMGERSKVVAPTSPRIRTDIEKITPKAGSGVLDVAIQKNTKETVLVPQVNVPQEDYTEGDETQSAITLAGASQVDNLLATSLPMPIAEIAQVRNDNITMPPLELQSLQQADATAAASPVVVSTEAPIVNAPAQAEQQPVIEEVATNSIKAPEETSTPKEETSEIKEDKPRKPLHLPIEAGIKFGYSSGFDREWKANKFVFAPYVEYRLPGNFSILFQPSYQTGNAKTGAFENSSTSYHELTDSSFNNEMSVVRGKIDSSILTPNPPDTVFRSYAYSQTYDSVSVSYGVSQQRLWDIELPVMLKYRINNTFSVMAGASATYSSVLQTKENVQRFAGLKQQYTEVIDPETFFVTQQGQQPPNGPDPKTYNEIFSYNTSPFSGYQPRPIVNTQNFFRYGFMVGASATFKDRLIMELLLHKSGVNTTAVPDKQLQKLYTQPYLRFTVGYKLFK